MRSGFFYRIGRFSDFGYFQVQQEFFIVLTIVTLVSTGVDNRSLESVDVATHHGFERLGIQHANRGVWDRPDNVAHDAPDLELATELTSLVFFLFVEDINFITVHGKYYESVLGEMCV